MASKGLVATILVVSSIPHVGENRTGAPQTNQRLKLSTRRPRSSALPRARSAAGQSAARFLQRKTPVLLYCRVAVQE
jgi:hypothetical protein